MLYIKKSFFSECLSYCER